MLSSLDLLLLPSIEEGITTVYRLREEAGLSPGTTLPALRRLEKSRLIRKAPAATRSKAELVVTITGKRELASGMKDLLSTAVKDPPPELEAVLRLFAMASSRGLASLAKALLGAASEGRKTRLEKLAALNKGRRSPKLSAKYASLVRLWEVERIKAEIRLLERLAPSPRTR